MPHPHPTYDLLLNQNTGVQAEAKLRHSPSKTLLNKICQCPFWVTSWGIQGWHGGHARVGEGCMLDVCPRHQPATGSRTHTIRVRVLDLTLVLLAVRTDTRTSTVLMRSAHSRPQPLRNLLHFKTCNLLRYSYNGQCSATPGNAAHGISRRGNKQVRREFDVISLCLAHAIFYIFQES